MRMEFEPGHKWHHFAFRARTDVVLALREALREHFRTGHMTPLRTYFEQHAPGYRHNRLLTRVNPPIHEIRMQLKALEMAARKIEKQLSVPSAEQIAAGVSRHRWEFLVGCVNMVHGLIEQNAPDVLIEINFNYASEELGGLFFPIPEQPTPVQWETDAAAENFEAGRRSALRSCVEVTLDPFPVNLGIGGHYDLVPFDPEAQAHFPLSKDDIWKSFRAKYESESLIPRQALIERSWLSDTEEDLAIDGTGTVGWAHGDELRRFALQIPSAISGVEISRLAPFRAACLALASSANTSVLSWIEKDECA